MQAGKLRHRVTIEAPVVAKTAGVQSTTWETYRPAWVAIETLKGFDRANAQTTMPGAEVIITTRYIAGLTSDMRIVHGDMIYSILGQPNDVDGRHREHILTCDAGVRAQ